MIINRQVKKRSEEKYLQTSERILGEKEEWEKKRGKFIFVCKKTFFYQNACRQVFIE
jgi:hypothetical protein